MKTKMIMGVGIVGLAAILIVQHLAQNKLRQEDETLRQQIEQLKQLQTENQRLADQLAEANKSNASLKEQLNAAMSAKEQSVTKTPAATSSSSVTPIPKSDENVLPKDSWSKAGFATPADTLKTRGWSILNGDREQFAQSISLTDGARKMIEDQLVQMAAASKDPDAQKLLQQALGEKWGAEEAILMPLMALNQNNNFTGFKILSEQSPSPDQMILNVETDMASGSPMTETLIFQRFGGDWKVVIDEDAVKRQMNQ